MGRRQRVFSYTPFFFEPYQYLQHLMTSAYSLLGTPIVAYHAFPYHGYCNVPCCRPLDSCLFAILQQLPELLRSHSGIYLPAYTGHNAR